MIPVSGYSGKVRGVEGFVIEFDCGAKHNHTEAKKVIEGDFVLIDRHGRLWVKAKE